MHVFKSDTPLNTNVAPFFIAGTTKHGLKNKWINAKEVKKWWNQMQIVYCAIQCNTSSGQPLSRLPASH
jgi:hypothetical protein